MGMRGQGSFLGGIESYVGKAKVLLPGSGILNRPTCALCNSWHKRMACEVWH